ncbi:hypothetical protein Cch01nite_33940 [Cellulomonas chitinilytica]|uniref:Glycosyltransferase n=1 Tax=Cellulomonas chitinilytica TaxID=398759 RepID=A0A919U0B9_9CELL|nr:glycosyltransferase family 4 protein [Cellulomonas chitinilytica]GIG22670.1 hypothetical protein Cch01nite_33940 [Cellulomonas chitinilytica]
MTAQPMRVAMVTPDLGSNSLGRTYALWLLCRALGWDVTVVSTRGDDVWAPLRGTPFADDCRTPAVAGDRVLREVVRDSDLTIAVKPFPWSFGAALRVCEELDRPLLLDIDDPDIEYVLSWERPAVRSARSLLQHRRVADLKRMSSAARRVPTTVSNPVLRRTWGGEVVPHARVDPGPGASPRESAPVIAFIGTNRPHKGLPVLRHAVQRAQSHGYRLVVTADPPRDAHPWEEWIGQTSMTRGLDLAASADVVVVPSLDSVFARGQLPAKLVDAMLLGRAVVATDLPAVRWALGGAGVLVRPGSAAELADALGVLADPAVREAIGGQARAHALASFTVEAARPPFEAACRRAVS